MTPARFCFAHPSPLQSTGHRATRQVVCRNRQRGVARRSRVQAEHPTRSVRIRARSAASQVCGEIRSLLVEAMADGRKLTVRLGQSTPDFMLSFNETVRVRTCK